MRYLFPTRIHQFNKTCFLFLMNQNLFDATQKVQFRQVILQWWIHSDFSMELGKNCYAVLGAWNSRVSFVRRFHRKQVLKFTDEDKNWKKL